jgi:hypothetical protein
MAATDGRKIFITHLAYDVDEDMLRGPFSKFGTILEVKVRRSLVFAVNGKEQQRSFKMSSAFLDSLSLVTEIVEQGLKLVCDLHPIKLSERQSAESGRFVSSKKQINARC